MHAFCGSDGHGDGQGAIVLEAMGLGATGLGAMGWVQTCNRVGVRLLGTAVCALET